jgi:hypothetical protein
MGHVILLGDSIFDNARYVPDRPPVVEQVRRCLPQGWRASLLALDGNTTEDVARQLVALPADATHLFVSAGGNDALLESGLVREPACTVGEALVLLHEVRLRFQRCYQAMLRSLAAVDRPTTVCTVYDAIPDLGPAERVALAGFNEIILREAVAAGLPVIDLRLLCDRPSDFSPLSSIEPSVTGGMKIARAITEIATGHDFSRRRSVIYA